MLMGFTPQNANIQIDNLLALLVKDEDSAAFVLQKLVDTGRKAGLQIYLEIEEVEYALPEAHRLSYAVLSLDKWNDLYVTSPTSMAYDPVKLAGLVGLA
jgi:hypothetical protein